MRELADSILKSTSAMIDEMRKPAFLDDVAAVGRVLQAAARAKQTIFVAGNGGSWADADHFAGELRAQFETKGRPALPAIAVPVSLSTLTAWGNDYAEGFETAMTRDLQALVKPGDVVIGISTSGKAKNVRHALKWAKEHECITIGISGNGPKSAELGEHLDHHVIIPESRTARIQEGYQIVIHILCSYIDAP